MGRVLGDICTCTEIQHNPTSKGFVRTSQHTALVQSQVTMLFAYWLLVLVSQG